METGQRLTGLSIGPESATCLGAARQLAAGGWIRPEERVVIFNCGPERSSDPHGRPDVPLLDPEHAVDWTAILSI